MIEAGTLLQNRYRVEKQIGLGGMGAVFVATDERFGSTVAIKETLFSDEKFRKAFEREAKLLNSLKHPALPRVSDHFTEGNGQFLVMEYVEGDDLSEIMERERKAFAIDKVLNWTTQLLDALEYLHTQKIPVIHRDIKPQNLKLTPRGQIVLLDFGLAKGSAVSQESATAAKSMFGYSRNYASLEQIQGTGTDPRSDLYSLAATVYHLLTGVPPADALTRAMNVLSEKADPLVPVREVNREIPERLSEVLYSAMALNANQRPASAKAMREMLAESEKISGDRFKTKAQTPPVTDIFTQKTKISEEPAVKQAAIKTEVLPENETSTKVTILRPVTAQTKPVETETKSSKRGLAIAAALGTLLLAGGAFSAFYLSSSEIPVSNSNTAQANIERATTVVNSATENANIENINVNTESNADWTNAKVPGNAPQKQETTVAETEETATPKPEVKPTKKENAEQVQEEEESDEEAESTPTPMPSRTPIFIKRFPRFPANVNIQPIPQENQQHRRRRQRPPQPQPRPY
jgi:eukaryotic-like serine/threonine-protein kinase